MIKKNNLIYFICEILATFFYIGYIPFCPGTVASFVTLILLFFLPTFSVYFWISLFVSIFFIGVFVAKRFAFFCNHHDPSSIVIDEVLGMGVGLFMVPKVWWLYGISFVLFRFFDISKFFGIYRFEKIQGGWGIMLDDFVAGLLTAVAVNFIKLFAGF